MTFFRWAPDEMKRVLYIKKCFIYSIQFKFKDGYKLKITLKIFLLYESCQQLSFDFWIIVGLLLFLILEQSIRSNLIIFSPLNLDLFFSYLNREPNLKGFCWFTFFGFCSTPFSSPSPCSSPFLL